MYIESVPNRSSPPAILLRESYRKQGIVKKRTIANISTWKKTKIAALRAVLSGETRVGDAASFEIIRSLPHGAVAAVLGTIKRLGLGSLLTVKSCRKRDLVTALIASRILSAQSKLATYRELSLGTATTTLSQELHLTDIHDPELYSAMDWLLKRQPVIETRLAKMHLVGGTMVLYDLTSVYFEGKHCPLTHIGYSRDGKKGTLQIMVGLLTSKEGIPVATEVFSGNVSDSTTLAAQIEKVRIRFGISEVIFVGDRGTITTARITEDMTNIPGLSFVTALRSAEIKSLVREGSIQLSLFDEKDLVEIESPSYPGTRLICCRNPFLAKERATKREALLAATEKELAKIATATKRDSRPLVGKDTIGIRVGRVINKYKMAKHFSLHITETTFSYQRNEQRIKEEQLLDGIYVIRTTVEKTVMDASSAVATYKMLSNVERAFRTMKTIDLHIRPVHHHLEDRVRAHVFLCMLAYYVEWHMKKLLAPMLFEDEQKEETANQRSSMVAKAVRSDKAKKKDRTKKTEDGLSVHSFRTLLADLSTITRNTVRAGKDGSLVFDRITHPTPLQQKALDLLQVSSYL